jgi:hypothetical protein
MIDARALCLLSGPPEPPKIIRRVSAETFDDPDLHEKDISRGAKQLQIANRRRDDPAHRDRPQTGLCGHIGEACIKEKPRRLAPRLRRGLMSGDTLTKTGGG